MARSSSQIAYVEGRSRHATPSGDWPKLAVDWGPSCAGRGGRRIWVEVVEEELAGLRGIDGAAALAEHERGGEVGPARGVGGRAVRDQARYDGLAGVEGEGGHVHDVDHVGVHAGLGHHGPAVGVADEDRRSLTGVQRLADSSRVAVQVGQRPRVGSVPRQVHGDDVDALGAEQIHHRAPAPRAVPRPVHEHHPSGHPSLPTTSARRPTRSTLLDAGMRMHSSAPSSRMPRRKARRVSSSWAVRRAAIAAAAWSPKIDR